MFDTLREGVKNTLFFADMSTKKEGWKPGRKERRRTLKIGEKNIKKTANYRVSAKVGRGAGFRGFLTYRKNAMLLCLP